MLTSARPEMRFLQLPAFRNVFCGFAQYDSHTQCQFIRPNRAMGSDQHMSNKTLLESH